jgi:hypothetical protein
VEWLKAEVGSASETLRPFVLKVVRRSFVFCSQSMSVRLRTPVDSARVHKKRDKTGLSDLTEYPSDRRRGQEDVSQRLSLFHRVRQLHNCGTTEVEVLSG